MLKMVANCYFFKDNYLFRILNGSTFRVSISQKNQFLLLSSPETSDAFSIEFDDSEGNVALVEHDNLVFISTIINDMSESQETVGAIENGRAPSRIAFMSYDNVLIVAVNGFVERRNIVIFIRRHEMILVQFDGHSHCWRHDLV